MNRWLENETHRESLTKLLEQTTDDPWELLAIGMLRSGLADDTVKKMLLKRFGLDLINRGDIIQMLIQSIDDQPELAKLVIQLVELDELNATEIARIENGKPIMRSARAALLKWLRSVPASRRSHFRRFLHGLTATGENGEQEAARRVLEAWK
jgi:hypothetical protein